MSSFIKYDIIYIKNIISLNSYLIFYIVSHSIIILDVVTFVILENYLNILYITIIYRHSTQESIFSWIYSLIQLKTWPIKLFHYILNNFLQLGYGKYVITTCCMVYFKCKLFVKRTNFILILNPINQLNFFHHSFKIKAPSIQLWHHYILLKCEFLLICLINNGNNISVTIPPFESRSMLLKSSCHHVHVAYYLKNQIKRSLGRVCVDKQLKVDVIKSDNVLLMGENIPKSIAFCNGKS